jgi:hypothetical protein
VTAPLKSRFARFLEAIRPTKSQRDLAKEELDFLEGKLREFIQDDDPFSFVKALRSGGFPKHTSLRRTEAADFDADLAVYVTAADGADTPVADLVQYLENLTRRAYENRTQRKPKFVKEDSCVRIIFDVTPKINIDVVPVVALDHDSIPNWGLIPRRDGTRPRTSVTEHIEFVRSRNNNAKHSVPFHQQLRLWKRWRNHAFEEAEHDKVSNFLLELVLGKAFDESEASLTGEALNDLSILARWIIHNRLAKEISFPDKRVPAATVTHSSPVIVIDPVNRDNNVAATWTTADRDRFLQRVDEFRDVLRDATLEADEEPDEAIAFLEQVFPGFGDLSEE